MGRENQCTLEKHELTKKLSSEIRKFLYGSSEVITNALKYEPKVQSLGR